MVAERKNATDDQALGRKALRVLEEVAEFNPAEIAENTKKYIRDGRMPITPIMLLNQIANGVDLDVEFIREMCGVFYLRYSINPHAADFVAAYEFLHYRAQAKPGAQLDPHLERFEAALQAALAKASAAQDEGLALIEMLEGYASEGDRNDGPALELPEQAPSLWIPRGPVGPKEFFETVWGEYRDAGVLYQSDLRARDPRLMSALERLYGKDREGLRMLIPNAQDRSRRKLAALRPGAENLAGEARRDALRVATALEKK
ncbi:MAG: hypothetical protein IIZ38_15035 [Sphingomonas sp.]|uniref:hypothetical protein n=1 Tax=Sphingomonas sp. TaxID=28214 RepID=UPI0025E9F449|nr:hypothetical protein [Sphingomonas sp.]MBQ1499624.1 hypothetical protein [Sphingomonas sp.]MBQ8106016.1 hypothetical protein [Afipia sp.]